MLQSQPIDRSSDNLFTALRLYNGSSTLTSRKAINKTSKGFQYKSFNLYYSRTQKLLKSPLYNFERAWGLTFSFYPLAQISYTSCISNSFAVFSYSFFKIPHRGRYRCLSWVSIYWAIKSSGCDRIVKPILV